jgi:hypothetical protein
MNGPLVKEAAVKKQGEDVMLMTDKFQHAGDRFSSLEAVLPLGRHNLNQM